MNTYQKYKERSPRETVFEVRRILNEMGVFPVLRWTGECRKGLYSNRITLYPTALGTNGKGTDELYSTASGYGELMERLENNVLLERPFDSEINGRVSFLEAPDEEVMELEEILRDPDPFTRTILDALKEENEYCDGPALMHMYSYEKDGKEVLDVLPFADPLHRQIWKVPVYVARRFTGTNGMAAGNTMEEAMVQGLSELFEREVLMRVLEGKAVPPEIPDSAIESYDFFERIRELRRNHYRVQIFDCSLGRGWPVVATCIHDPDSGRFGFNFGSHPSFPVAIERTLTEAAQGKPLESFAAGSRTGSLEEAFSNANLSNITHDGMGIFPKTLFCRRPDWEFQPWTRFSGPGNREFLGEMMALLKEEGFAPLVRDTSFLGFPSCFILIPGFHPMKHINGANVRLKRTAQIAGSSLWRFPDITEEEARRLLLLIRYWAPYRDCSIVNELTGISLKDPAWSNDRLGAWLALSLKDYKEAGNYFARAAVLTEDSRERRYFLCMKEFCRMKEEGFSSEEIHTFLKNLYTEEEADRVQEDTRDVQAAMKRMYPPFPCPECDVCPYRGKTCSHTEAVELFFRILPHFRKENASQEALLELLCPFF